MSRPRPLDRGELAVVVHDAALLAALFWAPVVWGGFGSDGLAFTAALVGAAALAALLARWHYGRGPARLPNAIHLPALAFLALSAASALASVSPHASRLELVRLAIGALLFLLVANRALLPSPAPRPVAAGLACSMVVLAFVGAPGEPGLSLRLLSCLSLAGLCALVLADRGQRRPVAWLRWALVISAAFIVALYGLREKLIASYLLDPPNPRWAVFSTFFNPNPLAGFLAMAAPLALAGALAAQGRRRMLWAAATLVLLAAMAPTYSKGGVLALGAALALFAVLWAATSARRRRNLALVLGGLALVGVLAAGALWRAAPLRQRVVAAVGLDSHSNMFRLLTWQGTARMAFERPWLGVGPGAFKYAYTRYAVAGYVEAAHQNYLQIAAEQGLPGAAAFLWLVGAVLFTSARALRHAADCRRRALAIGGTASVVALLVHSFLDYDWYIGAIGLTFWFAAGALAHLSAGDGLAVVREQPEEGRRGRRRRARRAGALLEEPAGARPLPWPRSAPGRALAFAALAVAIVWCVALPARNALAARALRQGNEAVARAQQALMAGDTATYAPTRQAALAAYRRATELDPGWGEAWHRFGLMWGVAEGGGEGVHALQRAQRLEPANYRPHYALGRLYTERGQHDDAAAAYQEALARFPSYTTALRALAESHQRLGQTAQAREVYQRMLEVEQSSYNRYRALEPDIDVDTEYAYAHYHLGRAALAGYQSGERPDALPVAAARYQEALRVVRSYFESGAFRTDDMFLQVGQPRPHRAPELQRLEALIRWRMADVYEQLGDGARAEAERAQARSLHRAVEDEARAEDQELPA